MRAGRKKPKKAKRRSKVPGPTRTFADRRKESLRRACRRWKHRDEAEREG